MKQLELKQELNEIKNLIKDDFINKKEVWTSNDLLRYTGMSYSKLTKLTSEGLIPHYKPTNGQLFFDREEVITWIKEHRIYSDQDASNLVKSFYKNKKA